MPQVDSKILYASSDFYIQIYIYQEECGVVGKWRK